MTEPINTRASPPADGRLAKLVEAVEALLNDKSMSYAVRANRVRNQLAALRTPLVSHDPAPDGATHMRRPEYLAAWLFDRKSTMPLWLIEKYKSQPLPDDKIGHYATAIDGEFWRWVGPAKFSEMFIPVAAATLVSGEGKTLTHELGELVRLADDRRVSNEAIGMRIRNYSRDLFASPSHDSTGAGE